MNDVEVLKRFIAPITKVYSESVLPPETGLEGVAFLVLNNDFSNGMTLTFIHDVGTTIIPVPTNASFESHIKAYMGIIVTGASTDFDIFVKEIL